MTTAEITTQKASIQLKSTQLTVPVLHLYSTDTVSILNTLKNKARMAPQFFKHTPAIVDMSELPNDQPLDYIFLFNQLRTIGLIPIALRGAPQAQEEQAKQYGLAVIHHTSTQRQTTQRQDKLVTSSIKAGQQVQALHGDLIITGAISAGAELIASGNIHVYGTLRGRALAGIYGNKHAQIFCHRLNAELISIAGHYKQDEQLYISSIPQHAFLNGDELIIQRLHP